MLSVVLSVGMSGGGGVGSMAVWVEQVVASAQRQRATETDDLLLELVGGPPVESRELVALTQPLWLEVCEGCDKGSGVVLFHEIVGKNVLVVREERGPKVKPRAATYYYVCGSLALNLSHCTTGHDSVATKHGDGRRHLRGE